MSSTTIVKESALFGFTPIEDRFITDLLPTLSGAAVKVYLHALMLAHKNIGAADEIGPALELTDEEMSQAYCELERAGAVRISYGENGNMAVQFIRISECETSLSGAEARRYSALLQKLRLVLGTRNISGAELRKIYDWIEVFNLDEDAAVEIVRHCVSIKGIRINLNYMDSVAKRLAADGLRTLEQVKASFERESKLNKGAAAVLRSLGITKKPTDNQLALYEKWTGEWGFSDDTILLIASTNTASSNNPSFKYLDAILFERHERGDITEERMREISREEDMIAELRREALERAGISTQTQDIRNKFNTWVREYRIDREIILLAADISKPQRNSFFRMNELINSWHERGIATYTAAKEDAERQKSEAARPENAAKGKRVNKALGYKQQQYTKDQLKALGIDFGEDVYQNDED